MSADVRPPLGAWLFWIVAGLRLCVGVTAMLATIKGGTTEYIGFALRQFGWAFALAYIGWLMYDNARLRKTPLWRAAADAHSRGWQACADAQRKIAAAEAKRAARDVL